MCVCVRACVRVCGCVCMHVGLMWGNMHVPGTRNAVSTFIAFLVQQTTVCVDSICGDLSLSVWSSPARRFEL